MSLEKIYTRTALFINQCFQTSISILKVLLISKFNIRFPVALQESCIILGNGPSLNTSLQKYSELLKKHALICVNGFSMSDAYVELKPAYYVILDPGFWVNPHSQAKKTIELIIKNTTWELTFFAPQIAAKTDLINDIRKNPKVTIVFFNYTVFYGFQHIAHFFYKKNLAMPQSQNVLIASLFIAINLHFKKIYLVGADHTWHETLHLNAQNELCVKQIHFYDNEQNITYTPFYKDTDRVETFKMHEIMQTLGKSFYGYHLIRNYATSAHALIYNASDITFIDAFERSEIH